MYLQEKMITVHTQNNTFVNKCKLSGLVIWVTSTNHVDPCGAIMKNLKNVSENKLEFLFPYF